MSNQLLITGGAKVRNLQGVITGTSGVLGSLGINVPDGIPQLDGSGKILVSQLPNSVMEYKGTWNVATNTPYLVDGVGNAGDVYIVTGAATGGTLHNFGAGNILFYNGDQAIYDGSLWQRASGSTGSVTSVAMTTPTGLSVTGSPITTNGTLALSVASGYSIPLTTQLVPTGGTTGQILAKNSDTAFDTTWIDNYTEDIRDTVKAAVAINKGQAVYISGASGTNQLVSLASYDSESLSSQTLGISLQTLAINDIGQIITYGLIAGLNTSTATAGDPVYLGANGALIFGYANKPQAPYHLVYMGVVTRVSATVGEIFVNISNGWELDELHNVKIVSPSNNQGIFYNSSNSLWENKSIATALGYTPANDSLVVHLAGTETITGAKTFSSVITGDAGIILKEGVVPSSVGYTGLAGDADGLLVTKKIGSTAYTNLLYFNSATSNTYTFPASSGTIALSSDLSAYVTLATTQTISGDKTFSGDILAINYYRVQQNSSIATAPSGYSTFGAINTKLNFGVGVGVSTQKVFQLETSGLTNNTTRVYTLPDATGTIALTSNLSSYLPLSGGTLTGGLSGTSATFSGAVITSGATLSTWGNVLTPALETINGNTISSYNSAGIPALYIASNAYHDGTNFVRKTANSAFLASIDGYNSTFQLQSASSSSAGSSISWTSRFFVNGTNGNVGIGTSSPYELLTINNGTQANSFGLQINNNVNNTSGIGFAQYGSNATYTYIKADGRSSGFMAFSTNDTERMRITSGGNVLIGTTTDASEANLSLGAKGTNEGGQLNLQKATSYTYAASLDVWQDNFRILYGSNTVTSGVNLTIYMPSGNYAFSGSNVSDKRIKNNINSLNINALDNLLKLETKSFYMNNVPNVKRYGFIAQEVKEIIPDLITGSENGNDVLGLDYNGITTLLVKAIQEQQAQIEELKQLINK